MPGGMPVVKSQLAAESFTTEHSPARAFRKSISPRSFQTLFPFKLIKAAHRGTQTSAHSDAVIPE